MLTSSNMLQANVTIIAGILILLGIANFNDNPTIQPFDDPQEIAYILASPFLVSSIFAVISGMKKDDDKKISTPKVFCAGTMILGFVLIIVFLGYKSITW